MKTKNFLELAVEEAKAVALGIRRARKAQKKAEESGRLSQVGSGAKLIRAMLPLMVDGHELQDIEGNPIIDPKTKKAMREPGVRQMFDERRGKGGWPNVAVKLMKAGGVTPEQAAFITVCTVHDSISESRALTATAFKVAERIETQSYMSWFKKHAPKSFAGALEQTKTSTNYEFRRQAMIGMSGRCKDLQDLSTKDQWKPWRQLERARVGLRLIERMCANTESVREVRHERGQLYLHITEEFKTLLEMESGRMERLRPFYSPLPCEPEPWKANVGGGYPMWFLPLVKAGRGGQGDPNENPTEPVLAALNALQNTAFRVNEDVYTTINEMWKNPEFPIPNVPAREYGPEPERPACIGKKKEDLKRADMNEEQRKALSLFTDARRNWKSKKAIHESKLLACATIRFGAEEQLAEVFWFPQNYDSRGRAYAIPSHYQPQSSDLARGLMEFNEGKAFDSFEAAKWFCVMLATHYGIDDCDYDARVDWVDENEDLILATGRDPLANYEFWCGVDVDAPFQLLAAILEYTRWADDGYSLDFVSHLPVPLDGSCNGIQHFSALLRDPVAAKAVNLIPSEKPADIYTECAEELTRRCEEEAKGDDADASFARQWLKFGISRKCLKRMIMTVPYNSSSYGTHRMIEEYLSEVEERTQVDLPFEDVFRAINYLNPRAHAVVNDTVLSACEVMNWLQVCTRVRADHNLDVHWTTPSGFKVRQNNCTSKQGRVTTHLGGGAHLGVRLDTKKVHKGEQVNAIAANFIHSQDASHLHLTVTAMTKDMKSRGQTPSFSMIHDSYATHAKDTPLLAKTLREEFVRMYEDNNPLEQFKLANQFGMSGVFQLSFIKFGPEEDVTPALMEKVTKELKKVKLRKNQKTGPCELLIDRGKLKEMEDFTRNIQPVLDEADVTMEVTNLPAGSLPDYPESGELDLQTVLQSVYFFG